MIYSQVNTPPQTRTPQLISMPFQLETLAHFWFLIII